MALAAFALARGELLALPRGLEFCNEPGLFIFDERSGDLPHHLARGVITVSQVVAAGSKSADAALDQRQNAPASLARGRTAMRPRR